MSELSGRKKLNASLFISQPEKKIIGHLTGLASIKGGLNHNVKDPLDYTGTYEVVSKPDNEQTLETAKRYLNQNIIVKPIPYAEVSNILGGRTVTIGG